MIYFTAQIVGAGHYHDYPDARAYYYNWQLKTNGAAITSNSSIFFALDESSYDTGTSTSHITSDRYIFSLINDNSY